MKIGVPKEIKTHEYRIGLTPGSVRELVAAGHELCVERHAGVGIGASDIEYEASGATISDTPDEIFFHADMIVKVKEPLAEERRRLRSGQILFSYLHLAADRHLTEELMNSRAVCIAYETVTDPNNQLPLLRPMSQVAGRLSIQAGGAALENIHGGSGVLLGGVPGVEPGRVAIIGGGVVGSHAAQMAVGLGAHVTVLDRSPEALERIAGFFGSRVEAVFATRTNVEKCLERADLVIGAVLVPGATAPHVLTKEDLSRLRPGSVVVDVAIDQGGCFETSMPTTHEKPTYLMDGIVHYCVSNMPGAVARTATHALNMVILPHVNAIANGGWKQALAADEHRLAGLNIWDGRLVCEPVARSLGLSSVAAREALH